MSASVVHHPRVQVVSGPLDAPAGQTFTQGYTAWCDDEDCAERDEHGRILVMWRGATHLVGFESAPAQSALIDARMHDESRHPKSPKSGEANR